MDLSNLEIKDNCVREKLSGLLIFIYLVLFPFYLWESGLPQIADFILLLFLIISLFTTKIKKKYKLIWLISFIFIFYVTLVDLVWSTILSTLIIMPTLYFVYNFLVMLFLVEKINSKPTYYIHIILKGVISSLFLQFAISMIYVGDRLRAVLFFNNPNQLGFFVLLMTSLLFILYKIKKINSNFMIIILLFSSYLMILSVSQGAIASFAILILLFIALERHKQKHKIKLFFLAGVIIFPLFLVFSNPYSLQGHLPHLDLLIRRVQTSHDRNEGGLLTGRGYDRIFNHPQYLIFGAGEGEFWRFDSSIPRSEIHSTLGSLLFSYGIIGFSIFLILLFMIIKKNDVKFSYPLAPIFIYGLTHNGIRQTLFWIALALLITVDRNLSNKTR